MKVYSDLDIELDLVECAPVGTFATCTSIGQARVRRFGWDVTLHKPGSRRHANTGTRGAGDEGAASWDDYGRYIARLFARDSAARIANYDGREEFHRKTQGRFFAWSAFSVHVAREVSLRRPDLASGDAIAVVLTANPSLSAAEVIALLDEAESNYKAERD